MKVRFASNNSARGEVNWTAGTANGAGSGSFALSRLAIQLITLTGPLHGRDNPFLNPPRSDIATDLGDREDEYSRRVSSIPLGSWDYPVHDGDSGLTLVHSNASDRGSHLAGSTGLKAASFYSQYAQDPPDSAIPSPSRAYQGRWSRTPFPNSDLHDNSIEQSSSSSIPENNIFPTGLKRRQNLSNRDKARDFETFTPPRKYDIQHENEHRVGGCNSDDEESSFRNNNCAFSSAVERLRRSDSSSSLDSEQGLDPDDPRITGKKSHNLEEIALEKEMLRSMDYRSRRKYIQRIKIEFNVSRASPSVFAPRCFP